MFLCFALGFQHFPGDLANVNEWKIMFDPSIDVDISRIAMFWTSSMYLICCLTSTVNIRGYVGTVNYPYNTVLGQVSQYLEYILSPKLTTALLELATEEEEWSKKYFHDQIFAKNVPDVGLDLRSVCIPSGTSTDRELRHEKTCFLHMLKRRPRSAVR